MPEKRVSEMMREAEKKVLKQGHKLSPWENTTNTMGITFNTKCEKCGLEAWLVFDIRETYTDGDAYFEPCPPSEGWEKRKKVRELQDQLERATKKLEDYTDKVKLYSGFAEEEKAEIEKLTKKIEKLKKQA